MNITCEMTGQIALSVSGGMEVAVSVDSDGPIIMSIDHEDPALTLAGCLLLPDEAEAIAHALIVAAAKSRKNADHQPGD